MLCPNRFEGRKSKTRKHGTNEYVPNLLRKGSKYRRR